MPEPTPPLQIKFAALAVVAAFAKSKPGDKITQAQMEALQQLLDSLERPQGRPKKSKKRQEIKQLLAAGETASKIREQTGASFTLIKSVRDEGNQDA